MQTDVLIIGGGLSGLMAAWQLSRAGANVKLLEARSRFGGRVLTAGISGGAMVDLGPSWFWPGQPVVATLLNHFNISFFEQYASGNVLFQQPDGTIVNVVGPSPMAGAYRMEGGIGRLVNAIANEIDPTHRLVDHRATGISRVGDRIIVDAIGPSGGVQIEARQVALAMPPRLAAELRFTPELSSAVMQTLRTTPTWMAGHAKFFAIYDKPFWREKGLCGTAISRQGPLAEIHDASPNAGSGFALFGFAGLDALRRTSLGEAEFIRQATEQLTALFGPEASHPTAVYFQDWSQEAFTASAADRQPQTRHSDYGLTLQLDEPWQGKLDFISSESSYSNGGLVEGALASGANYAKRVAGAELRLAGEERISHTASMDWDWIAGGSHAP